MEVAPEVEVVPLLELIERYAYVNQDGLNLFPRYAAGTEDDKWLGYVIAFRGGCRNWPGEVDAGPW